MTGRRLAVATALLVIAATAIGLRFWRLTWGLADDGWFPDEIVFSARAAAFVPLSWASFDAQNLTYPTLFGHVAGLVTALAAALGLIASTGPASPEVILVARGVSAAAGVLTVGLVGLIAARLYSARVGLAAAALMAVVPFHAMYDHIASTDVLLTACAALTLLASDALSTKGSITGALLAGGAAGLTFGAKYTGLALLAPVAWAILEYAVARRAAAWALALGLAALAGFALAAALACPSCALHSERMFAAMHQLFVLGAFTARLFHNNYLAPTLGWYGRPYVYQLVAGLPFTLGWPLYALALVGVAAALRRHARADRILLVALLVYFLAIGGWRIVFPRYLMPLFPALVILAAAALPALPGRGRLRGLALAGVWLYSLALAASQVARFSADEQQEVARFIARTVPATPGARARVAVPQLSRLGIDYYRLDAALGRAGLVYLPVEDGRWFDAGADAFVLPEWRETAILRDTPLGRVANDLARLRSGAAGYHPARRWDSWFLQRDLYTRLDPAFAGDLWQGEIGFTVYLRNAAPAQR